MNQPKSRIWELDAMRGFCILCMVVLHGLYDLQTFLGFHPLENPVVQVVMQYGGILFVLLSGLCATLGRRSFRRGVLVFACGMGISLVTWLLAWLGLMPQSIQIRFGVLHLLGICMMLWPLFRRLPVWLLAGLGVCIVVLGGWFGTLRTDCQWLFPLGIKYPGFATADYFPIFPQLGWFLLGAVLGKTCYREKQTRFPHAPADALPVRGLRWCGTHSLWIYLLHQPVLYVLVELIALITG